MNKGWFPKYWRFACRYFLHEAMYSRTMRQPVKTFTFKTFCTIAGLQKRPLLTFIPSFFVLKALSHPNEDVKKKNSALIVKADALYDNANYDELYELLSGESESDDPEILWRLARALFEKSRFANPKEKLELLEKGYELVLRAMELNENCSPAHRWAATLLDYVWRCKSTKGRIQNSLIVKKYLERAVEIDPKDSTSHFLLGEWCYAFADMKWYERRIATMIFGTPPSSTFEEAYSHYKKAEEMNPGFYSSNLVMLGKSLMKMKRNDEAIPYLLKAYNYPIKTPDDKQAREDSQKLLKELDVHI